MGKLTQNRHSFADRILEPATQPTANNGLAADAVDAVADRVAAAAIGPGNFAGGGERRSNKRQHPSNAKMRIQLSQS